MATGIIGLDNLGVTLETLSKNKAIYATIATDWKEYDRDNKRYTDVVIGKKYECSFAGQGLRSMMIKVKNHDNMLTQEKIDLEDGLLEVDFENFRLSVFANNKGDIFISGEADKITFD